MPHHQEEDLGMISSYASLLFTTKLMKKEYLSEFLEFILTVPCIA